MIKFKNIEAEKQICSEKDNGYIAYNQMSTGTPKWDIETNLGGK